MGKRKVAAPDKAAAAVAWYQRTGHCHACGQPGAYCLCTSECPCHELHPVGAGRAPDALDAFAEVVISDDQGSLFG